MDDERFDELVAEAIDMVPPELAKYMENVAIVTQEWPTAQQQRGHRGTLLGLYQGINLTRRGPLSYRNALPDLITIFKGPHCRMAGTEAQLRRRVAKTVIHEIGHHFGISDGRLRELGW
jgi:predicted Zn-dependent protease with MMP-like domain